MGGRTDVHVRRVCSCLGDDGIRLVLVQDENMRKREDDEYLDGVKLTFTRDASPAFSAMDVGWSWFGISIVEGSWIVMMYDL